MTRTHWVGWIENIQPDVNRYGKRTVHIAATGAMQFMKAAGVLTMRDISSSKSGFPSTHRL
jgi:hypothetical protein